MRRASGAAAAQAGAGDEAPAESWGRTLAHSNIRLPDPRSVERVKLKLTHRRPDLGWPMFDAPTQRIIEKSPKTVVLEISRPSLGRGSTQIDETPYLKPNSLLQSDDPEVMRLARAINSHEPYRFLSARKLHDCTASNIKLG